MEKKTYSEVIERFIRYVKVDTQSSEDSDTFPSTDKQFQLAKMLVEELHTIGASNVRLDEKYCYVYAKIPSNLGNDQTDLNTRSGHSSKCLGFIAHMDTSPEVSGTNVNPQIHENYDGKDIVLGKDLETGKEYILSPKDFPELLLYLGQDLITTDGSTLLGADDKAGVAEIMTMASMLLQNPQIRHGDIAIAFTPDEEVGSGVDHFDIGAFGADYAYTVDGGKLGEIEYENFNAASAKITVKGRSVHPGSAKDTMKNASLMAMELEDMLPQKAKPEYTEGYEGFYHLIHFQGGVEQAEMQYIIRDHDRDKFESKKEYMTKVCEKLNHKFGEESFHIEITDQYYNMKEKIEPHMFLVDNAKKCMEQIGITPIVSPIRGGTDGARLSFMGLPCPNLCAGGHNFHGRFEYCSIQSVEKIVELLVKLSTEDVSNQ